MERLGRWRDGIEKVQDALKRPDPLTTDPTGTEDLRRAAWDGLDRMVFVSYRVEKPDHTLSNKLERTTGKVRYEVGGYRNDGSRVDRLLSARVTVDRVGDGPLIVRAALEGEPVRRAEAAPRFRNVTADAGLGAPRNDPPVRLTNRLIARHLARLRRRGPRLRPGRRRGPLRRRRGAIDPLRERRARPVHGRHGRPGLAASPRQGIAATGVAAGDVDGDGFPDLFVTDAFGPARLFRNRGRGSFEEITFALRDRHLRQRPLRGVRRRGRRRGPRPLRLPRGGLLRPDAGPSVRRERRPRQPALPQRRGWPLRRRDGGLGRGGGARAGPCPRSSPTTTTTGGRTSS